MVVLAPARLTVSAVASRGLSELLGVAGASCCVAAGNWLTPGSPRAFVPRRCDKSLQTPDVLDVRSIRREAWRRGELARFDRLDCDLIKR